MANSRIIQTGFAAAICACVAAACSPQPTEPPAEQDKAAAPAAVLPAPEAPAPLQPAAAGAIGANLTEAAPLLLGANVAADIQNTEAHHIYKVDNLLKARDRVLLRFENLSSTLKPDVKIYDQQRSLLTERYDGTPGASLDYVFTLEPGSPVFVEVLPYGSSGRYRLSLTPQNAYDKYEPNGDALTAAAVKTGADIEGNILDEKDEDWYRVSGATGKTLSISLENQSVTLKPDIKIYNSNKSNIMEKYDATPGANLIFDAPAEPGKDIYVQILPYGSSGKYKLTVK